MKSVFGLKENNVSALSYVFGWLSGIIILIMEKNNKTVRFHALQSTIFFGAVNIIQSVLGFFNFFILSIVVGPVLWAVGVISFIAWVYLIYTAHKGIMFKLPIIGDIVWDRVNK